MCEIAYVPRTPIIALVFAFVTLNFIMSTKCRPTCYSFYASRNGNIDSCQKWSGTSENKAFRSSVATDLSPVLTFLNSTNRTKVYACTVVNFVL